MSASSKKKLRKEQEAAKMTEKQLTAQKEAKKTNLYTIAFVTVLVVLLVIAIFVGVKQTVENSGIREKKTIALTVNDHQISNAELNYFYMDAVNNFYSTYGSYAAMFGFDVTQPLDEQVVDESTGRTRADDFMDSAKSSAKAAYAVADAAAAEGFTLSDEDKASLDSNLASLDLYAVMNGFSSGKEYLKAYYGNGATLEGYQAYCELMATATAFQSHYAQSLTYEDADLRAVDAENYGAYSSFSYNSYYLATSRFLEGGTPSEDGSTTNYTDEERAASVTAAEEAAKSLTADEIASVADFNAAIAALPVNAETEAASTVYEDALYSTVSNTYAEWISDESRKEGDKAYFPSTSTTTDADGN